LQKLEEEEKKTLDSLAVAEAELVQQGELLKELISDLERRSEWSTVELLQVRRAIQPAVLNPCQLPSRLCP
jgi:tripartite motif-containing protein 6/22/34